MIKVCYIFLFIYRFLTASEIKKIFSASNSLHFFNSRINIKFNIKILKVHNTFFSCKIYFFAFLSNRKVRLLEKFNLVEAFVHPRLQRKNSGYGNTIENWKITITSCRARENRGSVCYRGLKAFLRVMALAFLIRVLRRRKKELKSAGWKRMKY